MREPYRTLFEGYEDHWLLGPYLLGDEPDWEGIGADDRIPLLSSGEAILLRIAGAFTGDRSAGFWELAGLDDAHRHRVALALLKTVTL